MNLCTAAVYAQQGYPIYRKEWWESDWHPMMCIDSNGDWIMCSDPQDAESSWEAPLHPDDCVADDWLVYV